MPDSVKCLGDIKSDDEWFSEAPKRGWPGMSKIGKKIPCRSCPMEAVLVIWKKIVRFEMFDEVEVKQSFENLSNSRSKSSRAIVGGVGAVTLLRNRLNKCMQEIRMRRKGWQRAGASSSANSFRNLGGMPSGPEALPVFKERSTQLFLWHNSLVLLVCLK